MIDVIASIRIKDGHADEFIEKFNRNVPNVLAEEGCIDYYPTVDADSGMAVQEKDAQVVTIVEKWESLEALQAHSKAPHMVRFRESVKDIVEGTTLKVLKTADEEVSDGDRRR